MSHENFRYLIDFFFNWLIFAMNWLIWFFWFNINDCKYLNDFNVKNVDVKIWIITRIEKKIKIVENWTFVQKLLKKITFLITNNWNIVENFVVWNLTANLNFLIDICMSFSSLIKKYVIKIRFLNLKIDFDEMTINLSFFDCENS